MGEKTGITWTDSLLPKMLAAFQLSLIADAIGFEMPNFMAVVAKSDTVGNIITQFGMTSKRLDVMSTKISAFIITTILTSEIVACKNGGTPNGILGLSTIIKRALRAPVREIVSHCAAWGSRSGGGADLQFSFGSMQFAKSGFQALMAFALLAPRFFRMDFAFERRYPTFGRFSFFHATANETRRVNTIRATFVFPKPINWFPGFTACASFQSRCNVGNIFINRQPGQFSFGL
jgi:hypothetical protein